MTLLIKGEVLIIGSQYLEESVLITNPKKRDINLSNELSSFNGKKVKITVEVFI